jgi:hypothetical protein
MSPGTRHKAVRRVFLLPIIVASACTHSTPAADQTAAIDAYVDALASRLPPEHEEGYQGMDIFDAPSPERASEKVRIANAAEKLLALGIVAFPTLIARSDDPRYSTSEVIAVWNNFSVGDMCFRIIASQVDFYGVGYKARDGANGKTGSKPEYLWHIKTTIGLRNWWNQHRTLTLCELQTESLRWTIAEEEALGFTDESQREQILDPLQSRLRELTGAATTTSK